jgi:GNAT superfamily N-acetyltransferase
VDGAATAGTARDELPLRIRGPLLGQGAAAERILRALPGWFGIESSLVGYVRAADGLPTFVAVLPDAAREREKAPDTRQVQPDWVVGFVTLKETSADALELHVMGVLPGWHRHGAGRALVEHAASYARAEGFSLLHVKTLAPSHPDPGYAATRAFYAAAGFLPLEVIPEVWGPDNPCLLLVRPL